MFLELSVWRASGSVACPQRPCERESSSFCPVRKRQWANHYRLATNLGIPLERGWGPEERRVRAVPECRPAVHLGKTPPGVAGVDGWTTDKGKWVGSWVGGFEVWLAKSLVKTGGAAREPSVDRLVDTQAAIWVSAPFRETSGRSPTCLAL